ncbi:UNKNOWN [Stylonychia lemnae]|uniref:Uncharacterized protein n=1 Tax=Stylonychia lemnae TaxID=5949 RepID=A0A078A9D1_STYLE|nr:UNKNOWN [Stylonychia lemnae]|eukprot:CDW78207.1 UNKNOWN [Stylonychia lemnae]
MMRDKNFKQELQEVALNKVKQIKETPMPKYYNLKSMLMIAFGGVGLSLMLKYQSQFHDYLPKRLHINQPYPEDQFKVNMGKQSLYFYSQSLYFQALSGWSIIFLKRSRMVSPLTYLMASVGFLVGTYLIDYYKHPNLKHSLWFLFNISTGAILGSYFYQQNFYVLIDALYLIGNCMTFYAASNYYNEGENKGMLANALGSAVFGTFYGLGVLRLFRWGFKLDDPKLFMIVGSCLGILMSWSIHRSICVQDEYNQNDYNPINAALSFVWKQIPQVSVFVDAFYHNRNQDSYNKNKENNQKSWNQLNTLKVQVNQDAIDQLSKVIDNQKAILLKLLKNDKIAEGCSNQEINNMK